MTGIVITGAGVLHPRGRRLEDLAAALESGRPPETPTIEALGYHSYFPGHSKREKKMDRVGRYACCAGLLALRDAGLEPVSEPARSALVGGTMFGGLEACAAFHEELRTLGPDFINPVRFPNTAHNVACSQAAINLGIEGPTLTIASGLCAGLDAVLAGARLIHAGRADVALAGGYDRWFPLLETALGALGYLSARPGEPGLRPAEGACFLVLESARHARRRAARAHAEILGWGQASDPSPGRAGDGLARALRRALRMAGDPEPARLCLGVEGRPRYDAAVLAGYREVLGDGFSARRLRPKEVLGETFGAAGPFAIAAALAVPEPGPVIVEGLTWGGAASALVLAPVLPAP